MQEEPMGSTPDSSAGVGVGDRVVIAKHRATVRFVGPVAGQDGLWVGVEWDDPSRGKHDGAGPGGARYFTCCSPSPTAGSFVRASKVSPGKALVEALTQRYTNQLAEGCGQAGSSQQQHAAAYLSTSRNRKLLVELVGQEQVTARQSQLELLTSARVVGAGVSHVGAPGELAAKLPKLQQLCLSDNLLSSWATVSSICQELPQLQLLDVSLNRLALPSALPRACGGLQQLPGLRCLVLNHCDVTWQQVAVVQSCLPHLEELHLAGNSIHSLHVQWGEQQQQQQRVEAQDRGYLAGFLNLQVLGLEGVGLSSWGEVARLAWLPSLRRLALSGNPIASLTYPRSAAQPGAAALFELNPPDLTPAPSSNSDGSGSQEQQQQEQSPAFAHLQVLLLADCGIGSWRDVDELGLFPALRELRVSDNPLFQGGQGCGAHGGRRFEVIGRVGGLTLLNGADVKPRERRDCELRYLQNILADQQAAAAAAANQQAAGAAETTAEQQQQHPRLAELQAKYGHVSVASAQPAQQQGSSLSSSTVELLLQHDGMAVRKRLPKTITVAALRLLCGRLFKLPPDQLDLQLLPPQPAESSGDEASGEQQRGEDLGADDTKQLCYWDVVSGCRVRVGRVDASQAQRGEAEAAAHLRQRASQQLAAGTALLRAAAASGR